MNSKHALISVSDKTNIEYLAKKLIEQGYSILSTGGTAKFLISKQIPIQQVSDFTGFPEMMDGRIKTLHPKIHAGILSRNNHAEDKTSLEKAGFYPIDVVAVNLYPFQKIVQNPEVALQEAIENIDIGGPCMVRASAKNHERVTILTDPQDYYNYAEEIQQNNEASLLAFRRKMAIKAFRLVCQYDASIEQFLSQRFLEEQRSSIFLSNGTTLRYGENSHQKAELFSIDSKISPLRNAKVISGKEMSYNNYLDANAAISTVLDVVNSKKTVCVIKHTNPCGLASANSALKALQLAWEGDPISAFGGIIAFNSPFDKECAEFLKGERYEHLSYKVQNGAYVGTPAKAKFVEVILAPEFAPDAVEYIVEKAKSVRLVQFSLEAPQDVYHYRGIANGILRQTPDFPLIDKLVFPTKKQIKTTEYELIHFGLSAVKNAKSNTIVLVRKNQEGSLQLLGLGAGQPNRVDSMRKLAITKATENLNREYNQIKPDISEEEWTKNQISQSILISDAFFPFSDTVEEAAQIGIKKIIQPGGSIRDKDSITICNEFGIAMGFTGIRHFNH